MPQPANPAQVRVYRRLRAKGVPHKAALALCKRATMAKAGGHAPYAALHAPIGHHGKNWVTARGGLPGPIDAIARVLVSKGWNEQRAVATAVSQAKKQCATGRAFGGRVPLRPESRAVICAAVARWEAMKTTK